MPDLKVMAQRLVSEVVGKMEEEVRKEKDQDYICCVVFSVSMGYWKYASSERGFMKKATEHIRVDVNPNTPYSTAFFISSSFRGAMLNFTKRSTM